MALDREQKQAIITEVSDVASKSYSAIAAEYRGLSVSQMNAFRGEARKQGVYVRVVKNKLAKRALEATEFACMRDQLVGPLLLAFSLEDPGAVARLCQDFSRENELFVIKVIAFGGDLLDVSDIDKLAKMPTYEQALSLLMSAMKAPVEKFVRTLAEPHAKFVRTLAAVRDKKEKAA